MPRSATLLTAPAAAAHQTVMEEAPMVGTGNDVETTVEQSQTLPVPKAPQRRDADTEQQWR
eukprot:4436895-Prorocentrum_lima.AAC.1